MPAPDNQDAQGKVRLDKWLWAARFFKTRSIAKQAIEGGKVHCNGSRSKSSREIEVGYELQIRQGWDELTVVVKALSDQRGSAPQAALLYEETRESAEKRKLEAEKRKSLRAANPFSEGRPTKKDRRQIHRFKRKSAEDK